MEVVVEGRRQRGAVCLSSALLNAKTAFRRQNQKDRDSRVDCLLETGCFNNNKEGPTKVLEGEEKSAVCNKGLRDALLRGPKTFVLCNRKPSYSVLVGSWGRQNLGQNEACWVAPMLERRRQPCKLCSPSLLSLIEIPLRRRPSGRRKGGARS